MGIADRARDAVRPTNSLEPVGVEGLRRVAPDAGPSPLPSAAATKSAANDYTKQALDRYYVETVKGDQKHYDDYQRRSLVFTANDRSITSRRDDLDTIKAIVAQAELRGWQTVELKGTTEFRREAWIETRTRGIESRGYKPSEPDRQEADRRRAERERGQTNELRNSGKALGTAQSSSEATVVNPEAQQIRIPEAPTPGASPLGPRGVGTDVTASAPAKVSAGKALPGASETATPSIADNRKTVRDAQAELSPDGRIVLAALSEKIDRQLNKHNVEAKAQLKAFVASELVKKERAEGPVVLSADQRLAAAAPEPVRQAARAEPVQPARSVEPEAPRRSIGR